MKSKWQFRLVCLALAGIMTVAMLAGCSPKEEAVDPGVSTDDTTVLPETIPGDEFGNAAVGYKAAVVSANAYTSRVGMNILEAGGNAVDAAVAMLFANSLTEPGASSLAGAGFMTIYLKAENKYICFEGMETAPAAAGIDTLDMINEQRLENEAILMTVPGQVHMALSALEKYGTMSAEEVLAPVIKLAEEGFEVHISFEERANSSFDKLSLHEEAAKVFTNDGMPYALGDHFANPDYANTLRKIAAGGMEEFYKGELAQTIVDEVQRMGGILTMEDMAAYASVEREPIKTTYHGYEIVTQPPPSNGGGPMLEMFNILENYDLEAMGRGSYEYYRVYVEAVRLSLADGTTYFGDPDFYDLPIDTLISKDYAAQRAAEDMPAEGINQTLIAGRDLPFEKTGAGGAESGSTTHVSVIDEYGNMVATTHTIGNYFGSCIVAPGTGFPLNSHLQNQRLDIEQKDNPNFVQGGLRVISTMCPTLIVKDGEPIMAIGSPGSWVIPSSIVGVVNDVLLFDMPLQESINQPRLLPTNPNAPLRLSGEPRIPEEILQQLRDLGFEVSADRDWQTGLGSVAAIYVDRENGFIWAGGDNRRQYKSLAY